MLFLYYQVVTKDGNPSGRPINIVVQYYFSRMAVFWTQGQTPALVL